MNDCKHKHFMDDCIVCWFKLGHGIPVNDAPIRGDEGTDKHRQDCIDMALGISELQLKLWGIN